MSGTANAVTNGAIREVTINRSEVRNGIDSETAKGLASAFEAFESDRILKVATVAGAGGIFSAGMDVKAFARGERPSIRGRGLAGPIFTSNDAQEGTRAFIKKRTPGRSGS